MKFTDKPTLSSHRLQQLKALALNLKAESFYDIGCDHGEVAMAMISIYNHVYFVDPAQAVIEKLETTLKDSDIPKPLYTIYKIEGENLKLTEKNKTILIAGMGGKKIISILENLLPQLMPSDFVIISPHTDLLAVREFLSSTDIGCLNELLIEDRSHFYQVFILTKSSSQKVHLYEDYSESRVWERYLKHQKKIYQKHQDERSIHYLRYLESFRLN